jgi:Phosphoenolpyruvate carboxykinase
MKCAGRLAVTHHTSLPKQKLRYSSYNALRFTCALHARGLYVAISKSHKLVAYNFLSHSLHSCVHARSCVLGKRMSIKGTRACVSAVLDGSINDVKFTKDPVFGFEVPNSLAGVESNVLNPRDVSYTNTLSYYYCKCLLIY